MARRARWMMALAGLLALAQPAWAGSAAEARMRAGDIAGAIPLARAEARSAPSDLDAQERYIDLALHLGLHALVLPEYQTRVKASPTDPDAHYLLGRLALEPDEAKAGYEEALRLAPTHARAPMGLAAIERAARELASAEKNYRLALSRDSSLSEAWAGLQATLLQQNRIADAAIEARRALAALPDEPDAYIAVSTLEPERAIDVLKVGVVRVPDDPRLRNIYARRLLASGNGKEARIQTDAALKLAQGYPEADFLRMVARSMEDGRLSADGWRAAQQAQEIVDIPKAEAAWSTLIAAHPQSAVPWLGRGKVRANKGDRNGAQQDLAKAISLASDETEVQAAYGLLMAQQGQAAKAVPWLAKASRARPQDGSLAAAHVQAAYAANPGDAARKLAVAAYQAHPHSRPVVLATASVLSGEGDVEAAYIALRDALPKVPDPVVVVALAAAARDAGHLAEAADLLGQLARSMDSANLKRVAQQMREEATAAQAAKDKEGSP